MADVDTFFRLLKEVYGGYALYGGDGAFDKARKTIEENIGQSETLSTAQLKQTMLQALDFIKDGHFSIGNTHVNKRHVMLYFCNQEVEFRQDNTGYYYMVNDEKRYVQNIDGQNNLDSYLKLSINAQGELIYYLGVLKPFAKETESVTLEYKTGSKKEKDIINLTLVMPKRHQIKTAFESTVVDGIPVLTLRRLEDQETEASLKAFVESGSRLKDEPVMILDLRGNGGGTDIFAHLWIENYTGYAPTAGVDSAKKYSKLYLEGQKLEQDIDIKPFLKKYDMPKLTTMIDAYYAKRKQALESGHFGTWVKEENQSQWLENPHTVFVLIDKGVASSAENFISYLKTMDNVVFVGSNTWGGHDTTDQQTYYLPNTNLSVYMGIGIDRNRTEPHFIDGLGFEPDLWLNNEGMLERVIQLYKKHQ